MNLRAKHWSEGVLKLVVWLSGIVPYELVEEILEAVVLAVEIPVVVLAVETLVVEVQVVGKSKSPTRYLQIIRGMY